MPHLRTLRICGYSGSNYLQYEVDLLFSMISTTPNIRRLHIPYNIPYIYTDKLKDVHDIIINGSSSVLEEARSSPINSRVRELHVPYLVRTRLKSQYLLNSDRYGPILQHLLPSYTTFPLWSSWNLAEIRNHHHSVSSKHCVVCTTYGSLVLHAHFQRYGSLYDFIRYLLILTGLFV
jgi:hypothetical protein